MQSAQLTINSKTFGFLSDGSKSSTTAWPPEIVANVWRDSMTMSGPKQNGHHTDAKMSLEEAADEIFRRMDTNGDGDCDLGELKIFSRTFMAPALAVLNDAAAIEHWNKFMEFAEAALRQLIKEEYSFVESLACKLGLKASPGIDNATIRKWLVVYASSSSSAQHRRDSNRMKTPQIEVIQTESVENAIDLEKSVMVDWFFKDTKQTKHRDSELSTHGPGDFERTKSKLRKTTSVFGSLYG